MNAELKLAAEGNVDALRQWLRAHPDRINATYGVSQYTLLYTTVLHSNKVALASLASGSNAYLDTVRMLCEEFHADAGAPNGGSHNTVVHLAADMEALEILRYLLFDYHAPLLRNVFNETPLDVAVRAGKAKSIALLKQRMGEAEAEGRTPPNNNNNTTNTNSSSGNTSATPTPTRHDPTHMAELLGARGGVNNHNNNNNNAKGAHAKSYSSAESNHSHAEPAPPVSPGLSSAAAAAAASGGGGETNATRMQTMWATRRHRSGAGEKAKSHGGKLPQMSAGVGPAGLEEKNRSTRHPPVRRHMSSLPGNTSHAAQSTRSTSPPMNHSLRLQPTGLSAGREEEEEHEDENEGGEEEAKDVVRPATSGAAWYNNNNNNDRRSANTSVALFTVNDWADAPDPPRTRPGTTPLQPPSQAFGPATAAAAPPPPHRINTRHASQPLARPPPRGKHNTNTNITGTMGQTPPTGQAFPRHASGATAPSRSAEASFSLRERVAELRIQDDDDEDDDEGEGGEDDAVSEVQRGEGQSRNEDSNDEKEEEQEDKEAAAAGRRGERTVTTYDLGTHNCPPATVTSHTAAAVAAEKTMRRSVTENPTRWANKGEKNNNNNNNTMRREDAAGTAHLTSSTQGIAASQRTTTSAQPIHNSNSGASATTPLNADCPNGGCAAAQCSPSPARLLRAGTLARHESDWSSCTNFESNDLRSFRAAFGNAYRITACRDHCEIKGYLAYLYKDVEYYTPVIISIYSGRPSEQSTRSGTSGALYTPCTPSQGLTSTPSERADVDRLMRASHSSAPGTPPNVLARNATSTGSNNNNNNAAAASSSSSSYSYSRYRVMLNTELLGPYGIHRRAAYLDPLSKAFVVSPCDRTYNGLVAFLREAVIKNFQTMPPMVAETRPSAYPRYLPINRIDLSADSSSTNQPKPAGHKTSKSGGNTYIKDALPHRTQAQTRRYRILQDLSRFGDGYFNYVMGQHCVDGILPIFRETSSQTQDANSIGPRYRVLYPILGHMMESFPQSSPRHAADAAQPGSPPVYYTIPHASAGNEAVDVSCVKHVELLLYLRIRVQFTSSPSSSSSSGSPSPSSSSSSMSLYDGVPRIFLMDGRANRFMEACFARLTLPMTYTTYEPNRGGTPCELDPRALQPLLAHWNTTGSLFDLLVALRNLLTQSVKEYMTKYSSSNNNTTHTWHTAQGANVLSPLQTLFAPSSPSPSQQGNLSPSSANTAAAAAAALTAFFTPTPNPVPLAGSPLGVQQQQQQQPLAQSPMQDWFANNTANTNTNAEVQSDMMQFFGTGRPMSAYDLRMPGSDGAAMGTPVQGLYNNSNNNNNNMNSSSNEQGGMSYRLRCVRCMRDGVAKNALLLPCYHVALCAECVAHYQNHSRHGEFACPVCYEVVKSAYALELSA